MILSARGMVNRSVMRRKRRLRLWFEQRGLCAYCGDRMPLATVTFDHVKPVSKGGTFARHNIVLAHWKCNSNKANRIIKPLDLTQL